MDQKSYRLPLYFSTTVCYDAPCYGDVAQLEERDNRTVEVRGSSPLISTYQLCLYHETKSALQIANAYGIV